jgi:DUF1365 family protein
MMRSSLCRAKVMHKRLRPRVNQFDYRVFYLLADVDRLAEMGNRLLGINRRGLTSFYEKDYGPRDGSSLALWIRNLLKQEGIHAEGKIWLLTHPRLFGYAFNPVSFWFCTNQENGLIAVLAEVNNTFGERHFYLIHHENGQPITGEEWLTARKVFHVSPFYKVEGQYRFRFQLNESGIQVQIDYETEEGTELKTALTGKWEFLSARSLLRTLFSSPLMTFMVMYRIHYQALRLVMKRIPYQRKPEPPAMELTR